MTNSPKIIVALDFDDIKSAQELIAQLNPKESALKVGKGMFTRYGPQWVEQLVKQGFNIFLDLKFFDIPQQVEKACLAAADLGVWMINVHALGGQRMMETAMQALLKRNQRPLLTAVTILTSMNQNDLNQLGFSGKLIDHVARLAELTQACGLDGVVCSPQEIELIREICGKDFTLVTPGIRLGEVKGEDQQRVMTPKEAVVAGVDYMVIGRPITQASDPKRALLGIMEDL